MNQFTSLFLKINSKEAISTCIFDIKNKAGNVMVLTNYRGRILNQVSIDQRPAIVDEYSRVGDWELDTIIGKGHKQAIVSLTERKSRLTLIAKVKRKSAELVSRSILHLLMPIASKVFTLTSDNGKEFSRHQKIDTALQADFYFAYPYSSWEWGLNENTKSGILQHQTFCCTSDLNPHFIKNGENTQDVSVMSELWQ